MGVKWIERPKTQRKIRDQSKIKFLGDQEIKKKDDKKMNTPNITHKNIPDFDINEYF